MSQKNCFFLNCHLDNKYLFEVLQSLGWHVIGFHVRKPFIPPIFQDPNIECYQYDLSDNISINWVSLSKFLLSQCSEIIKKKNISLIFPGIGTNDLQYLLMGYLNSAFGLPGLSFKASKFWYKKSRYLKYFKKKGVKVPSVYQILHPDEKLNLKNIEKYPVICKPDCGTGGTGVFLAENPEILNHFFSPISKDEKISNRDKIYRPRIQNGQLANYIYDNVMGKYIVEEYIPGPVLEVLGIKACNGIEVSLIFEIIPSDPPFRSENEFLTPLPFTCENEDISKKVKQLVLEIVEDSIFPNGPFMFNLILFENKELYLLDASPRLSSTVGYFYKFVYPEDSYEKRCVQAVLNQKIKIYKHREPKSCVYLKRLPLPKGKFIHFIQKEPFSDYVFHFDFPLKSGDVIYRERKDSLMKKRGSLGVLGKNPEECKIRWHKEFQKLSFEIEEYKSDYSLKLKDINLKYQTNTRMASMSKDKPMPQPF